MIIHSFFISLIVRIFFLQLLKFCLIGLIYALYLFIIFFWFAIEICDCLSCDLKLIGQSAQFRFTLLKILSETLSLFNKSLDFVILDRKKWELFFFKFFNFILEHFSNVNLVRLSIFNLMSKLCNFSISFFEESFEIVPLFLY